MYSLEKIQLIKKMLDSETSTWMQ